jgi:hypothetical protein
MVLQERIELSTSPLPRECSTTELLQHAPSHAAIQTTANQVWARGKRAKRQPAGRAGYVAQAAEIGKMAVAVQ